MDEVLEFMGDKTLRIDTIIEKFGAKSEKFLKKMLEEGDIFETSNGFVKRLV